MRTSLVISLVFLAAVLVLAACAGATPAAPAGGGPAPAPKAAEPEARQSWQQEWESTLALAKQEGTVSIIFTGAWIPELTGALTQAFKGRYGINVEFTPTQQGETLVAKMQQQQRAGLYMIDLVGGGTNTAFNLMKPEGLLAPMEPLLILPEVKDPKQWIEGRFPFVDKDKTYIALLAQKQHFVTYNTDLVKKGELENYKDLLKPQFKGKITMRDPSLTGTGSALMTYFGHYIWSVDEARDFLRKLLVDQQAVIQRDDRMLLETVARGKFAVVLAANMPLIDSFIKAGAPVDVMITREGFGVTASMGGISAPTRQPHPNAARVFLNWLLTKEGLTIFGGNIGSVTRRLDVPVEGLNPIWRFNPGEKLYVQTEESTRWEGEMNRVAKQVLDEVMK
ncbi:MAG: extracellular solute-binding protein [Chloroflexi bacterium]|nr:extracellular solute-binding protein [Chloroflexota bacterium]